MYDFEFGRQGQIIPKTVFLTDLLNQYQSNPKDGRVLLRTTRHYFKNNKVDEEIIRWAIEDANKGKFDIRSRNYTMSILKEFRLSNLLPLLEPEFTWESLV